VRLHSGDSLERSFAMLIVRVPSETLRVSPAHLASLEIASLPLPADTSVSPRILLIDSLSLFVAGCMESGAEAACLF